MNAFEKKELEYELLHSEVGDYVTIEPYANNMKNTRAQQGIIAEVPANGIVKIHPLDCYRREYKTHHKDIVIKIEDLMSFGFKPILCWAYCYGENMTEHRLARIQAAKDWGAKNWDLNFIERKTDTLEGIKRQLKYAQNCLYRFRAECRQLLADYKSAGIDVPEFVEERSTDPETFDAELENLDAMLASEKVKIEETLMNVKVA